MDWSRAKKGDRVRVAPLGWRRVARAARKGAGEDAELSVRSEPHRPDRGQEVLGLVEAAAPAGEAVLKPPPKKPGPPRRLGPPRPRRRFFSASPQSKRNTLDLRGLRYN